MFKPTLPSTLSDLAQILLIALLVTDLSFILLHLLFHYTFFSQDLKLSLEEDRGYGEVFQYIKTYWIALTLGFLAVRLRSWLCGGFSLLFLYILLDDAGKLHERLGEVISRQFGLPDAFNLRGQDFGELLFYGGTLVLFGAILGITYRLSPSIPRKIAHRLIALLGLLVLFAILGDLLHSALRGLPRGFDPLLIALEDGGELLAMSLIGVYVFSRLERFLRHQPFSDRAV